MVFCDGKSKLYKGPSRHQETPLPEVQSAPHLVALVGIQSFGLLSEQRAGNGAPSKGGHH